MRRFGDCSCEADGTGKQTGNNNEDDSSEENSCQMNVTSTVALYI